MSLVVKDPPANAGDWEMRAMGPQRVRLSCSTLAHIIALQCRISSVHKSIISLLSLPPTEPPSHQVITEPRLSPLCYAAAFH